MEGEEGDGVCGGGEVGVGLRGMGFMEREKGKMVEGIDAI